MLGQLGPVAVTPYVRKTLEVGRTVLRAIRVIPECDGHTREWRSAHELSLSPYDRVPFIVEDFDLHAEAACLNLSAPHWPDWIPESEARDDVRPATDAAESNVLLHAPVHVVEAVLDERTSRRENRPQRAQIVRLDRTKLLFFG